MWATSASRFLARHAGLGSTLPRGWRRRIRMRQKLSSLIPAFARARSWLSASHSAGEFISRQSSSSPPGDAMDVVRNPQVSGLSVPLLLQQLRRTQMTPRALTRTHSHTTTLHPWHPFSPILSLSLSLYLQLRGVAMRRAGDWRTHPHRPRGYLFTPLRATGEALGYSGRGTETNVGGFATDGGTLFSWGESVAQKAHLDQDPHANALPTEAHLHRDLCSRNSPRD